MQHICYEELQVIYKHLQVAPLNLKRPKSIFFILRKKQKNVFVSFQVHFRILIILLLAMVDTIFSAWISIPIR